MTLIQTGDRERFVSTLMKLVNSYGVLISVGTDFDLYRTQIQRDRPDYVVSPPFDPDSHALDDGSAFWMIGYDHSGNVVHTQAVRLIQKGHQSLGQYFENHFAEFGPAGLDLDLARSRYRKGPGAMRMTGQVAYHGEFWITNQSDQYRGKGLSSLLSRYGFWHAMQQWDPDHIVAFIAQANAYKGLVERTGWMHTDPGAVKLYGKGQEDVINGFLAYLHREDLHYLLELSVEQTRSQAAGQLLVA